jgi:hypothetical protein
MRTLVFCTAYAADPSVWADRYRPWVDAVLAGGLGAYQVLLVDDGSASLPGWADTHVVSVDVLGDAFDAPLRGPVLLAHFRARRGRVDVLNFPGWHRSFCFAALYAQRHQFDRVIHIESDAFVISQRAQNFLAGFSQGWAAFWAARYDMPESAIQVAAGQGVLAMAQFARQPYDALIGQTHERLLPFSHFEKQFEGERHTEFSESIPPGVDYAAQVPSRRERGFAWFLPGRQPVPPPQDGVTLRFCEDGDGLAALRFGWSPPEPRHHWMVGAESTLILPGLDARGDAVLRLRVTPHVHGALLTSQRLIVEVNGHRAGEFVIALEALLGCDIPASWLGRAGGDMLRLLHPDAVSPHDLAPEIGDKRRLAVSLEWLHFERQ